MQGFVISDWQGIDRITSPPGVNYSYSVQTGVSAGIDMVSLAFHLTGVYFSLVRQLNIVFYILQIMVPYNFTDFIDDLTYQVKRKIIPMTRIDDAVRRILRVKFVMGLFENPLADLSLVNQLGSRVCIW